MRASAQSGNRATTYSPVRQGSNQSVRHHNNQDFQGGDANDYEFRRSIDVQPPPQLQRQQRYNQQQQLEQQQKRLQEGQTFQEFEIDQMIEEKTTPKEVYICDCCCVSKELRPTIKFMSTFRSLFFLFNFLVFAFGLANFGMGLWFRIDPKVYEIHKYIETQNFTIAGWIMLFGGFAACLMALVGFAAAARQAAGLLVFYFGIMILLTLAFVGTIVLLTVYGLGLSLENFLIKEIYEQIRRRTVNTEIESFRMDDAVQFLDFVQVKMRCCGAADFRDYGKLGMIVPTTCYTIDKNYIIAPGCGHAIRQLLDLRAGMAVGFTSGSIIAQLLTIITSASMFCSIYHWRATPRSTTPAPSNISGQIESPASQLYHQRPRSRTPIVI